MEAIINLRKPCCPYSETHPSFWTSRKTLTLFVKPFMDESDIDMSRIERCCFHNASPRGVMSFCALNAKVRPAQPHADEKAFIPLASRATSSSSRATKRVNTFQISQAPS